MSINTANLIQGPATLYRGLFGATEPASIATAPATGWTDYGATQGGITCTIEDTWSDLEVDQTVMAPDTRRSKRKITIKTVLAEATLQNLADAINNSAPASNVLSLDDGIDNGGFKVSYLALILDGIAPGGFRRRVKLRKGLSVDSVESAYKKDGQLLVPVTFQAYYVSPAIRAVTWEDATA